MLFRRIWGKGDKKHFPHWLAVNLFGIPYRCFLFWSPILWYIAMLYREKYKEKEIKRKAFSSLVCCQFALHSLSWHFVLITRPLIYNHVRKKGSKREAFSSLVCLAFPLLAFCSDHSCFQQITGQLRTNCAPTLVITEPIFFSFALTN